jgi:hypothetical protein
VVAYVLVRRRVYQSENRERADENRRELRGKKAAPMKKTVEKKLAKKRVTPKKKLAKKNVPPKKVEVKTRAGGKNRDLQGLSNVESADSESVDELLEEGNAFEADVVKGVEDAEDTDGEEVRTHEVPQDDVPGEYLDKG